MELLGDMEPNGTQVTQGHRALVTQSLCPMLWSPGDMEPGIAEPQ